MKFSIKKLLISVGFFCVGFSIFLPFGWTRVGTTIVTTESHGEYQTVLAQVSHTGLLPVWYLKCPAGDALGATESVKSNTIDMEFANSSKWTLLRSGDGVSFSRVYNPEIENAGIQLCDWLGRKKVHWLK